MADYVNITLENLADEHVCCAIADKKHQAGVDTKKTWLAERLKEGHVFRKLNARGKVFIEYAPLETAWVPVEGENYLYIYCLWVSGSYKGKGHGKELLEYCIQDARQQNKSGICVLSSKKKKPFLTDKKFVEQFGFQPVESLPGEYELLALSFDGRLPRFADRVKQGRIDADTLTIYYSVQCPYIANCIQQVEAYCAENDVALELVRVDTLEKAKNIPCIFNNWAVFYKGEFETVHLLNEGYLKKLLEK